MADWYALSPCAVGQRVDGVPAAWARDLDGRDDQSVASARELPGPPTTGVEMRRAVLFGGLLTLLIPTVQILATPYASANPTCPVFTGSDHVASRWLNSAVHGVEAPVQLRKTGTVCDPDGEDSDWVGIEEAAGGNDHIVQAGFLHRYNSATGTAQYCRVWANGVGSPHVEPNSCGTDPGGTYVYFRVTEVFVNNDYHYRILDCGTDGYTNCTILNQDEFAFGNPEGAVAGAEVAFGPTCFDRIMGSSSLPANVGTDVNSILWQNSLGGSWTTRSLTPLTTTCGHYHGAYSNTIISAWDDRN